MIVCDTGPFVAAALANDDHHHACVELFTGLRSTNWWRRSADNHA